MYLWYYCLICMCCVCGRNMTNMESTGCTVKGDCSALRLSGFIIYFICKCGQKKIFNFQYCPHMGTKMVVRLFVLLCYFKFNTVGMLSLRVLLIQNCICMGIINFTSYLLEFSKNPDIWCKRLKFQYWPQMS